MRSCVAAAVCGRHCHEASLHHLRKVKSTELSVNLNILSSSVSNFGTQREHNLRNEVYQTQYREDVTVKFVENAGKVTKWRIVCSLNLLFHCTH
jgi:hypothetical protein